MIIDVSSYIDLVTIIAFIRRGLERAMRFLGRLVLVKVLRHPNSVLVDLDLHFFNVVLLALNL